MATTSSLTEFIKRFARHEIMREDEQAVKSAPEAEHNYEEPYAPGLLRITARNWRRSLLDRRWTKEGPISGPDAEDSGPVERPTGTFLFEFADWCPHSRKMHKFLLNLAWVMVPVKQVDVARFDHCANDQVNDLGMFLQVCLSFCIILFLPSFGLIRCTDTGTCLRYVELIRRLTCSSLFFLPL
jgi:hypothetical protein